MGIAKNLYEKGNHLQNVLVTVSDKKIAHTADNVNIDYYNADVVSANDSYIFGMVLPGRTFQSDKYRYGFNGQEKSDEINDNLTTAEYWEYDSRIGRRWNNDPSPNISLSPYATFENNPIYNADPLGDTSINGQKMEGQNAASATTLPEARVTGFRLKPAAVDPSSVVQINTNVKCHCTNADVYEASANKYANRVAAANNGKGLDVAHGQRYLPINPLLNFIIGGRVDNSPSATGTGYDVSADGYVSKTPRPFTGIPPAIGMKGGSNLAFGLRNNLNEFSEAEGLLNYRQFTSGGFKPKEILSAIENPANTLHFNLTGFSKYRYAKFNPGAVLSEGNITNWELHSIYNTPGALQRTTFYQLIDNAYKVVPKPF